MRPPLLGDYLKAMIELKVNPDSLPGRAARYVRYERINGVDRPYALQGMRLKTTARLLAMRRALRESNELLRRLEIERDGAANDWASEDIRDRRAFVSAAQKRATAGREQ